MDFGIFYHGTKVDVGSLKTQHPHEYCGKKILIFF
jgi:hypothetical protein